MRDQKERLTISKCAPGLLSTLARKNTGSLRMYFPPSPDKPPRLEQTCVCSTASKGEEHGCERPRGCIYQYRRRVGRESSLGSTETGDNETRVVPNVQPTPG